MPKPKKPQPITATVSVSIPRTDCEFLTTVEIDPNSLGLSDKPTIAEINKIAEQTVIDKLKTRVTSDGRTLLSLIKQARAAKDAETETETE